MGGVFLNGRDQNVWTEGKDLNAVRANNQTTWSSGYWLIPSRQHIITLLESTIALVKILCTEIREQRPTVTQKPDVETSEYVPTIVYCSDLTIFRIASFLGTILSSILPVMAIVVLYRVAAMSTRLGLVGTFTAVFPACLKFMTDARLIEVFSATSAYVPLYMKILLRN